MGTLKQKIYSFLGQIYIPKELLHTQEGTLLHISDTTRSGYTAVNSLIQKLKPKIIIHTGNLVADIRSWDSHSIASPYEIALRQMMTILHGAKAEKCIIALGEKDNPQSVREANFPQAEIVEESGGLQVRQQWILYSNDPDKIYQERGEILFHGEREKENKIHVMDIASLKIYELLYPVGTQQGRHTKMKRW